MANLIKQSKEYIGVGQTFPIKSGVTITAGDAVGLDSNGQVVQADKTTGPVKAMGFAVFNDNFNAAPRVGVAALTVYCSISRVGVMSGQTGLTIGGQIYLSTAGGTSQTPAATNGDIDQLLGFAISATDFEYIVISSAYKFQTAATSTVGHL